MTIIKLPAKQLADLENEIVQLQQQLKNLNGRCDAQQHLIDYLIRLLPYKKQLEIFEEVKSLSLFYKSHPEQLDGEFCHPSSYASVFHVLYDDLEFHRQQKNR